MNRLKSEIIIQSKALDILGSFDKKELLQFGKYLDTYMVSNRNLKKLYLFLKRFYPEFSNKNLTKSRLYKAVYGDSAAYNDHNVRKLLSDISREAESFIAIQHLRKNKLTYDKILLDEFDTRMLDSLFNAKYDELNQMLDSEGAHFYQFLEKHIIEWTNVSFHLERGMQEKIALNVYKRAEYIIFYLLSDLFTTLQDINANIIRYNVSQKVSLAEEFMARLDIKKLFDYIEENFPDNIILRIYYLSFNAFRNLDDEKYYYRLKELAAKNLSKLHENSRRAVITFLINYCVKKIAMNRSQFSLELNENYNTFIKHKLYRFSGENYMRIDLFLHILTNYFDMGKIALAGDFLNDNIQIIQPVHRANMLTLCNALIEFEKGEFAVSLKHAVRLKQNTKLYKDALRILILKNNYELKNYEAVYELTANYRKSLEKNENIADIVKEKNLNFLNYLGRMLKLSNSEVSGNGIAAEQAKELYKGINSAKNTVESKWLLKKLDELSIDLLSR